MRALRRLLIGVIVCAGCKTMEPLPEVRGGIEIGLRRGAAWTTMTVKPPYIIGPSASLKLSKGVMTGSSIGRGVVRIEINREGALGQGPGRVDVDFEEGPDEYKIDGVWNSAPVHLSITSSMLKGSINGGTGFCQYTLDKTLPDGARAGFSICSGLPEETRLEIPNTILSWLTPPELAVILMQLMSAPPHTALEGQFGGFNQR